MNASRPIPHVIFSELTETLDRVRRMSVLSVNTMQQKKMLGLTMRQASAIGQVQMLMEKEPQGVALKVLAKQLSMTVPATSLLVESMVGKGFFERNPNPTDRRAVCIRLSEKGMELFDEVYANFHREIDAHSALLTDEELRVLASISAKLRAQLA